MSDLKQAVSLIKIGKKAEARRLLLAILKDNPDDEKAWLCMVSCAANSRQFNTSIRNVLRINPQNKTALRLADEHQIAVNVESATQNETTLNAQGYLDTTQVANPTETLKRDVVSEALSNVADILSSDHLAEEETVIFELDETVSADKATDNEKSSSRRGIVWLWMIAISAVTIITIIIVLVALSAQNKDEQVSVDETATSYYATRDFISSTTDAILVSENRRATVFFATETQFFATDIALQETLSAPTPTAGPTDTPLPDRPLVDYVQTLHTAVQIRGDPIQYENRTVFRPDENIYALVNVERTAPSMFVEVRISRPSDDTFTPISQTVRVVPDSGQAAIFTFQAGDGWSDGDYLAQVFVQDMAGLQTGFSVVSP